MAGEMDDGRQIALINDPQLVTTNEGAGANGAGRGRGGKRAVTTAASVPATIKSVRDSLRKDAGLSGDTDRLPQLTWLLFLKSIDDAELTRQVMLGDAFEPIIE